MRICAVASPLGPALKGLGHDVLQIPATELRPVFDLRDYLGERDFAPELILQQESLGPRTLLAGLESFACPKIFWSIDTHLNLFWHLPYLRLFDAVATPHASLLHQVKVPLPPVLRLPSFGAVLPWKPHAQRQHRVSFVGRITEQRPLRKWLAQFLEEHYQATVRQDLPPRVMLELYGETRLAPNESILHEVNFRLLEAASCGCLVFSQPVGEDQDLLFAPGREIQIYQDVLELKGLLDYFLARPELAERMGRAAQERVQREHLPEHRARTLLAFANGLGRCSVVGAEAQQAFWLTLWNLFRAQRFAIQPELLDMALQRLAGSSEMLCARLGFLVHQARRDEACALAAGVLQSGLYGADLETNLCGSAVGLLGKEWSLACQFWYRHCKSQGQEPQRPETPLQLALYWAKALKRAGALANPGLVYDAKRHLPTSAAECLYLALELEPFNQEALRQLDALFARMPGYGFFRLGALSELTLRNRENWRHALALGQVNLQSFRQRQGLEEIALAWDLARKQGKEESFFRALQGSDPRGLVLAAIRALAQGESPTAKVHN